MTSLALIPLLVLSADPKWELAAEETGIKVYSRQRSDSEIREMRAIGLFDATPQEVWAAVRDLEHYKQNMPYMDEAKVLSRDEGEKGILFYSMISVPLVDKRDYIIRITDQSDWQDGKGYLKSAWSVVNDKDDLVPVKNNVVRVRVNDGYWNLEPRDDGKKTFVTYYIYTSPGGAIPTFIANKGNSIAVPKVFEAIRETVKKNRAK